MSRYEIPGRTPGTKVAVGWDHPLLTYFVQVRDLTDKMVVWEGAHWRALDDLPDLKRAIRRHADLPEDLAVTLLRDRDEGR